MKWVPIKGYEERYNISDEGKYENVNTGYVGPAYDGRNEGYPVVFLVGEDKKKRQFLIHRLVAFAFVSGYSPELIVNHKDGNTRNNFAINLEWVTYSHNSRHAWFHRHFTKDGRPQASAYDLESEYIPVAIHFLGTSRGQKAIEEIASTGPMSREELIAKAIRRTMHIANPELLLKVARGVIASEATS